MRLTLNINFLGDFMWFRLPEFWYYKINNIYQKSYNNTFRGNKKELFPMLSSFNWFWCNCFPACCSEIFWEMEQMCKQNTYVVILHSYCFHIYGSDELFLPIKIYNAVILFIVEWYKIYKNRRNWTILWKFISK